MKTPADWDKWWDDFHAEHGRYPTWDELIAAVQRDALESRGAQESNGEQTV